MSCSICCVVGPLQCCSRNPTTSPALCPVICFPSMLACALCSAQQDKTSFSSWFVFCACLLAGAWLRLWCSEGAVHSQQRLHRVLTGPVPHFPNLPADTSWPWTGTEGSMPPWDPEQGDAVTLWVCVWVQDVMCGAGEASQSVAEEPTEDSLARTSSREPQDGGEPARAASRVRFSGDPEDELARSGSRVRFSGGEQLQAPPQDPAAGARGLAACPGCGLHG